MSCVGVVLLHHDRVDLSAVIAFCQANLSDSSSTRRSAHAFMRSRQWVSVCTDMQERQIASRSASSSSEAGGNGSIHSGSMRHADTRASQPPASTTGGSSVLALAPN